MSSKTDHSALLDQLQTQVNLVLEQTGRVFAAMSSNPKVPPASQLTKLKHVVPVASNRFHDALDQLESELQLAALVMRRDLAVCREQAGSAVTTAATKQSAIPDENTQEQQETPDAKPNVDASPAEDVPGADLDTSMQDIETDQDQTEASKGEDSKPAIEDSSNDDAKPVARETTPPATEEPTAESSALQLDTKTSMDNAATTDEPPNTANNDLDSLFNDTLSTTGGGNDNGDTSAAPDFSTDIDFGSFGGNFDDNTGDSDNISSLLPGLEDYANTGNGGGADIDFSEFFNTNTADGGSGGGNGNGDVGNQESGGEQRDTTFDDLMDLAGFEGMDGDGNGGNGGGTNHDLDFDSLFN